MFDDPDYDDKEAFKKKCNDYGIGFIDMTTKFVSLLNQKHVFPRGFYNTMPGKGHMNEHAHKIIAESIYDHLHPNVEAEPK